MLNLLQGLTAQGIPWLVFDWKRAGYRDLLATHHNVRVFTVGRDISPFSFNPLIPPPRVELIAWFKQFIQCISHAYFLGHGCEVIFQDVLGKDTKTLFDVLKKLHTYPANWRKLQWLQSAERAVKALCYGTIIHVLNVEHTPPIHHWLNQNLVFELDALTESEAKFFVEILMSAIYFYKRENQHRALHVSVIEEAHHLLQKENWNVEAKSVMDKIFREIREYGEALVVIDQMPSTLLHSAFANLSTLMALSLTHHEDVDAVARAMLLSREEQQVIGRLPVGTALVKLHNRWPAAFLVRVPLVANQWGRISDEAIQARVLGHLPKQEVMPSVMKTVGVITPKVSAIYAQIRQGSPETTISETSRQEINAAIERVKKGRKPNPKIARIWERVLSTQEKIDEAIHTKSSNRANSSASSPLSNEKAEVIAPKSEIVPEIVTDWHKLKKHLESIAESLQLFNRACMGLGDEKKTDARADERVIHSGKEVIHTGSEP